MEKKNETMMRFGTNFQENLCQLILEDRPFCDQIEEVLSIEFLELRYLQVFVKMIFDYRVRYGTHPTYEIAMTMLKSDLRGENEAIKKQVRDYFTRIMSGEVKGTEYIKDRSLDFCRKQVLKGAMMKSITLLKSSSFDEIQKIIDDALKLGTDNNFGHDFLKGFRTKVPCKITQPSLYRLE